MVCMERRPKGGLVEVPGWSGANWPDFVQGDARTLRVA